MPTLQSPVRQSISTFALAAAYEKYIPKSPFPVCQSMFSDSLPLKRER